MDDDAAAIAPHLAAGEKLLWAGRPHPPVYSFYNGGGMGCLGIFAVVSLAISLSDWRALILIVPLALFAAAAGWRGNGVRYGLTDRRAIIAASWPWTSMQSIPVDRFNTCTTQGWGGGYSSVMFRKTPAPWNLWRGTPFKADAFVGIKRAGDVERLIRGLRPDLSVNRL